MPEEINDQYTPLIVTLCDVLFNLSYMRDNFACDNFYDYSKEYFIYNIYNYS